MRFKTFLTVRSQSERLPNKAYMQFGESTTVGHMIMRAKYFGLDCIICTTDNSHDDRICGIAEEQGIEYFRGSENNKLLRWLKCAEMYGLETFHALDCDDLFFDGLEVSRSYRLLEDNNVVKPFKESAEGAGTVGYSIRTSVLDNELVRKDANADLDLFEGFLAKSGCTRIVEMDRPKANVISERLTLDFWSDYIVLSLIQLRFGSFASMEQIRQFLDDERWVSELNKGNTVEWKKKQNRELTTQVIREIEA